MKDDTQALEEVVVVGFGTQKKVNLTGAVSTVDSKAITARPINSVTDALQGAVAGMNFSMGNEGGALSASKSINIRGTGTIGSGSSVSPLILINGMEGDMNALNPQDIENISVLKDASASSIYGSRAAGGVILITTKSGKEGKTSINYNNSFRFNSPINMPEMMDSWTWANYMNSASINSGGGTGYSRGLVNSFLMRNGLPIYATGSGYDAEWEKQGVAATLQDRDSRIQLFTKKDGDVESYLTDGGATYVDFNWVVNGNNETRMTTGYAIKKGKHYEAYQQVTHHVGTTGSLVFRGTEAMLNYMEASYEKNGTIDATADGYWKALRTRAKVDADYNKTIAATDMAKEALGDFGAYSKGTLVDATLYNIRRERRNEFIAESLRWMDLKRWRACDQVKNFQMEGMRYWGSIYEGALTNDAGDDLAIVSVEDGKGNISSQEISGNYIRPYQISSVNNSVFDGYNFTPAHYLSPIPQSAFRQTASGDKTDLNTSVIYQNPGWPKVAGQGASEVN